MNSNNEIEKNSKEKLQNQTLTSKEKRALYMSQLRGSIDSEYRRIERENNARAMRKKRLENANYREHERRQNRAHMAQIRRLNIEYRQREHIQNRHRMALKRTTNPNSSSMNNNSIYEILENNLESSHISFIPYEKNLNHHQTFSDQLDILQQIDQYCRQQHNESNLDSSNSTSSC